MSKTEDFSKHEQYIAGDPKQFFTEEVFTGKIADLQHYLDEKPAFHADLSLDIHITAQ